MTELFALIGFFAMIVAISILSYNEGRREPKRKCKELEEEVADLRRKLDFANRTLDDIGQLPESYWIEYKAESLMVQAKHGDEFVNIKEFQYGEYGDEKTALIFAYDLIDKLNDNYR